METDGRSQFREPQKTFFFFLTLQFYLECFIFDCSLKLEFTPQNPIVHRKKLRGGKWKKGKAIIRTEQERKT